MKIKFWCVVIACVFLTACASPPLVLHKLDAGERGRVVKLSYNNYFRNSYQVVVKSVDGVSIEKAGSAELEEGPHTIRYEILDNYTTDRGTDFKFSSLGAGEVVLNLSGGFSYLLGTAGRSRTVQVVYKMPL